MNLIDNVLQNWSKYELNMEIFLILSIICVSLMTISFSTRSNRILILSSLSLVILLISNFLGVLFASLLLKVNVSEVFRMIPIISIVFLISNLGLLSGFYSSRKNAKGFKISSIRKEYLSDSIKQTVFLILLGISTLLFLSPQTEVILAISILSTVTTIWITFWSSKYILK